MDGFGGVNALGAFPPSRWQGRRPGDSAASHPAAGHLPRVRPLRSGWTQHPDRKWESSVEDPKRWEVLCPQCGDGDGPVEGQPVAAQQLRGPYPSRRRAGRAAVKHLEAFAGPRSSPTDARPPDYLQ